MTENRINLLKNAVERWNNLEGICDVTVTVTLTVC